MAGLKEKKKKDCGGNWCKLGKKARRNLRILAEITELCLGKWVLCKGQGLLHRKERGTQELGRGVGV